MSNKTSFLLLIFFGCLLHSACNPKEQSVKVEDKQVEQKVVKPEKTEPIIYMPLSELENQYQNFDSPKAINESAKIENEYFQNYEKGLSPYYGTVWKQTAEREIDTLSGESLYETFKQAYEENEDSLRGGMHCTIYAVEVLKAGLEEKFEDIEKSHKRIWKDREHAGWSIAHILVKEWNWKAYLIIDRDSKELDHCLKAYKNTKTYPVWQQPAIPLEALYIRGEEDPLIQTLLKDNEFGWGFSEQGWHTWFTRFDKVKECNWAGAPGAKYGFGGKPLFITTPFLDYYDYDSHIVVFPPKK